jgi:hypothetical protein
MLEKGEVWSAWEIPGMEAVILTERHFVL